MCLWDLRPFLFFDGPGMASLVVLSILLSGVFLGRFIF